MVWGTKTQLQLKDHFKGGKYVPLHPRAISVPLTDRAEGIETTTPERLPSVSKSRGSSKRMSAAPHKRPVSTDPLLKAPQSPSPFHEKDQAEQARHGFHGLQSQMDEGDELGELPEQPGLVEQRRLVIEVKGAVNLPIMDDEAGMTCDPYVILACGQNEAKTRAIYRTLDPVWKEKHTLKLDLDADSGVDLKVTVMDYDDSAHDTVGSFRLKLGPKTNPFPAVDNKYINHKISMAGVLSTATFEDWYELYDREGKVVYGLGRKKSLLNLHIQHVHEARDVRFCPTREFLDACANPPSVRSRREMRSMTRELVTQMPSCALLSSRLVACISAVGELKKWKKWDMVQLQNKSPSEDSLHLVLSGTFNLYAQSQGANAAMYRMLKGRTFGPETSFGPQIGWVGPGEGFGEAALLMHEGVSATSVCVGDSGGVTLQIGRRHCERIMEQYFRKESVYSPKLHSYLLEEMPKAQSTTHTLVNVFKQFDSRLFSGMSDGVLHYIVESSTLVRMSAGDVLELGQECSDIYVILYGTLSAHTCVLADAIKHLMPISGECIDVLGPGSTFGACAYVGASLRAREYVELLRIHRTTLIETYGRSEPFVKEGLATVHKAMHKAKKSGDPVLDMYPHPQDHVHQRKLKKELLYAMHLHHWLRSLESVEHVSTESLWVLVQKAAMCYLNCSPGHFTHGYAIVLEGLAKIKELVSSEKPSSSTLFNAGKGALILPNMQIVSSEGEAQVTVLMWSANFWDYAQEARATKIGARNKIGAELHIYLVCAVFVPSAFRQLAAGEEDDPQQTEDEMCQILRQTPLLNSVPVKILKEWMQPHVRRIRLPDSSVFATEGENDCSLYILVEGSVMIYKDREVDDHLYTSEITGLDVFQSLFGISAHELSAGDCFGQVELMLRSANSFTAVCKGPCELLVLDRAVLGNPDVESMIWLSLDRSVSDKLLVNSHAVGARKHTLAADEPLQAPKEEHHMQQEIEALKVYTRAKTHNITNGLSVRSAIFLCSHLHTCHAEKEEIVHLRSSNQPVSVLALITGQMVVHVVVNNAAIPTFGSAICSLRAGDIYDPHNAKMEDPGADERKLDQSALTKEQSEYFIVDSAKYRVAVKKNILDSSLFARSVLQDIPLFDDLPSFTFDKLSKMAKLIRCRRDEVAFCSTDTSNGSVILLAEGDFKVTKKTTNHRTVTRLGPGMLFGSFNESAGRANMQAFTVFATTESLMVQLPIKELVQQLPDATIKKLRKQLGDDMQHISFKARADAELESSQAKSNQEPTMPTSSLGIPVRRQQIGIVGMPEYQATWNSGNMTNFFENIANGKVLPYPEDASTKKLGRPPEEVLPSLRAGFVQRKLDEIQRKANGEFMKARNASDIFSKEELQAREAKKAGLSKLRLLQDRVDQLRDNEKMRQQLAERVLGHKHDIIAARSAQDWTLVNKKCPGDKAFEGKLKEEKRKKEDAIRDAMATQQEHNEKRWKEKMEHTYHVMNRKELNDENNLQRLEEIRQRASEKRRIAVLLMTCALAVRMESWTSLCLKVRKMRNQLLLWSAAAITLQRKWREHMHDVVGARKEIAGRRIIKCYRVYRFKRRAKRKYAATPVIATFLRELKLTMEGTQYHVRLFCKKITILQRNWRKYSALSHKYYQTLNEAWSKRNDGYGMVISQLEPKVRKEAAASVDAGLPAGNRKPAAPSKSKSKNAPKVPGIPLDIKMRSIALHVRRAKRLHRSKKSDWRREFENWHKREHYRRMIEDQKEMLKRDMNDPDKPLPEMKRRSTPYTKDHEFLKSLLAMDPLDPKDPPPSAPIFNPVPPESELFDLIQMAYEDSIEASKADRAASSAADPAPKKKK